LLCFRCGHNNPDTSEKLRFCDRCNAKLWQDSATVKISPQKQKTERLEKIISMGNNFINRICSREDFLEFLEKQLKSLEKAEKNFKNLEIPEGLQEEFYPQIHINLEGISLYKKSIEHMKSVLKKEKAIEQIKDSILQGMELAKKGNDKINECYKMSEEKLKQIRYETPRYKDEATPLF